MEKDEDIENFPTQCLTNALTGQVPVSPLPGVMLGNSSRPAIRIALA